MIASLVAVLLLTGLLQQLPPGTDSFLSKAVELARSGDLDAAAKTYEDARVSARDQNAAGAEAAVALSYADRLEEMRIPSTDSTVRVVYQDAIRLGTPQQKQLARNNLGVFLLRSGSYTDAARFLGEVDFSDVKDPETLGLYHYNFGKALEATKAFESALQQYRAALETRPDLELAVEGAFRMLYALKPARINEASEVAEQLFANGQPLLVGRYLRKAISHWSTESEIQRLLAAYLRYFAVLSIPPRRFQEQYWPEFLRLKTVNPRLDPIIDDIGRAYLCDTGSCTFPQLYSREEAYGFFPAWTQFSWQRKSLSELLKSVGDYYASENSTKALVRYSAAWLINPANTEVALYLAATIKKDPKQLDPQLRLANQLAQAYSGDNILQRIGSGVIKPFSLLIPGESDKVEISANDRNNITQLYVLLSDVSLSTAGTQLKRAQQSEQKTAKGQDPAVPGLHVRLAEAYERDKQLSKASEEYAQAASEFLKVNNHEEARRSLEKAASLRGLTADPNWTRRVQALRDAIQSATTLRPTGKSVMETLNAASEFTIFFEMLKSTGFRDTLTGIGPYTVLAVPNEVFGSLKEPDVLKIFEGKKGATAFLQNHVLTGALGISDLPVKREFVIQDKVACSNGWIYVVNTILVSKQ